MTPQHEEPVRRSGPELVGKRYRIHERIGRGAMGVVYRARDEFLNRDVAMKLLTADFEDDEDIRARFQREAEAAARLQHPNIISILDVVKEEHRFYIVMELLRGVPLKEFLKTAESASLERKLDLMIQLCAGINVAHKAEIFHRDIKPGNIYVRTDGILKILDFGVARLASSNMTASGFIVGTPDYMSPEQACGAEIDQRSDIFSIGGVFYYILSGRKPFSAAHLPTLFHQIQTEAPQPLTGVPPALAAIAMKALAKAPEDRYQSCEEMVVALERLRAPGALEVLTASPVAADASRGERTPTPRATPAGDLHAGLAPSATAHAETEDTVQLPVAAVQGDVNAINTDDTVSLVAQPSWWENATQRCVEVALVAMARLKRSTTPSGAGSRNARKRWM